MVRAIVLGSTTGGYCRRVPGRVAGAEVALVFPAMRGLPLEKYLVDLMLEEKRDRGIDAEQVKDAHEAVLHFHGSLPVAMDEVVDEFWGDEVGRKGVCDRLALVV